MGPAVSWLCAIGMMPVLETRPSVGFKPDEAAVVRGRHDRAVRLRAHRDRAEVRRRGGAGARARARRVAVERVRVAALPAAAAPAALGVRGAEVRPLREVRLAENHGAGVAQALDDVGVLLGDGADQGERARRRLHAVRRADVVLDQDRDPVERAAQLAGLALGIEAVGDREGVGVDLEDARSAGPWRSTASIRAMYFSASVRAESAPEARRFWRSATVSLVELGGGGAAEGAGAAPAFREIAAAAPPRTPLLRSDRRSSISSSRLARPRDITEGGAGGDRISPA